MFSKIQQHYFMTRAPLLVCIVMVCSAIGLYSILNPPYQFLLFSALCIGFGSLSFIYYKQMISARTVSLNVENQPTRILLVDDNRANRRIISELLTPFPIDIIEASSGQQTLDYFDAQSFELILMDIELEDMNGMDVAKHIRQQEDHSKRLPIIAISAHSDNAKKIHALAAGFDDYLTKPVDKDNLVDCLSRWLTSESLLAALKQNNPTPTHLSSSFDEQYETENEDSTSASNINQDSTLAFLKDKSTDSAATIKKVVDVKLSLKYSHNNHSLARDMLELLINLVKEQRPTIERLYKEKNWSALGELTHKINGGSCYCGVPELQGHAQKLEKALGQCNMISIEDYYLSFLNAIDNLIEWEEEHDIDIIFDD